MEQVTTDKLMVDLKVVVADVEELLKVTANQTGERIAAARAKAEASLATAKVRLAETQVGLMARTKEAAKTTDEYVHANPWEAVAIAAAFGMLLGMLMGRR